MPFNGSGVYAPPSAPGSFNPAISGQQASPADWNALLIDLSEALSNVICVDGQSTITADLPMAGFKFTGVGNAALRNQFSAAGQVQDGALTYAADTGAADAYAIALSPAIPAYVVGQRFSFLVANTNLTTTPTLAVNGLTAGTIVNSDGSAVNIGAIVAGAIISVVVSAVSTGTPTFQVQTLNGTLFLRKSANLSDLASAATANINLNTIAVVRVQTFTSSGTYTPSTGMVNCIIEMVGGGGGGGGTAAASGNVQSGGGGGGNGGYSRLLATAAAIGASQAITIGAAGAAGSAGTNSGGNGGNTSLGTLCIALGGTGGFGGFGNGGAAQGGPGGGTGTGTVASPGESGQTILASATTGITGAAMGGSGGSGIFGAGGVHPSVSSGSASAGVAGTGFGAGGSGGASSSGGGTAAGGAGTAGYVVITEFCNQ